VRACRALSGGLERERLSIRRPIVRIGPILRNTARAAAYAEDGNETISRTLMVDFGHDFLDGAGVRGVTQHVQNGVDVVARDSAFFLRVERVESLSQN